MLSFLVFYFLASQPQRRVGRTWWTWNITSAGVKGQTKLTIVPLKYTHKCVCVYRVETWRGVVQYACCLERQGGQRECIMASKCSTAWWASTHEHTYHSSGVSYAKSSLLSPACDVTAVLLYLLQQLADLLAVIGHFAFLQKSFQLDGGGERGWHKESARSWRFTALAKPAKSVKLNNNQNFIWSLSGCEGTYKNTILIISTVVFRQ